MDQHNITKNKLYLLLWFQMSIIVFILCISMNQYLPFFAYFFSVIQLLPQHHSFLG